MNAVFCGWRRSFGVATLLIACVLMCGWGRGVISETDLISFRLDEATRLIVSLKANGLRLTKRIEYLVTFADGSNTIATSDRDSMLMPYWYGIMPLTLLSALLLLPKPRPVTQKAVVDPNSELTA